jgi:hypothetical protein
MSRTFTLTIKLGNDAMQTPEDIADALRDSANHLERGNDAAPLMDYNGNTVGSYEIRED